MAHHDHTHEPAPAEPTPREGSSLTGYALAKYGIILLIVLAVLFFLAQVVIPAFTD
jgi:hypothetical protein